VDKKIDWDKFDDKNDVCNIKSQFNADDTDNEKINEDSNLDEANQQVSKPELKNIDSEDSFEILVGKDYVEVESDDKNDKEKVPVVSDVVIEEKPDEIINAPEDAPSKAGQKILYSADTPPEPAKSVNIYLIIVGILVAAIIIAGIYFLV
jgi:hypothetical protein